MSIEDLSARLQASELHANSSSSSLDLNNGCRGTISESDDKVTALGLMEEFRVEWNIKAPVPGGRGSLWLLKERVVDGRIHYGGGYPVIKDFPMGDRVGPGARLPGPLKVHECRDRSKEKCVLRLKWAAASKTFVSCADVAVRLPLLLSAFLDNISKTNQTSENDEDGKK